MQAEPLVSVIIPCYNYGKYLGEAIESVIAQTYSNWECIITNDGSQDNTEEVVRMYSAIDSRIKYIYQCNKGVAEARNTALREAKGDYIQLLDADDMLSKNKLALQVSLLETKLHIDLIYSDVLMYNHSITSDKSFYTFKIHGSKAISGKEEVLIDNLMHDNFFLPGCVLFRRKVYETVGPFHDGISGLEDWEYFYRMALLGFEVLHDDRKGTELLSRNHGENASKVQKRMLASRIRARKYMIEITKQLDVEKKLSLSQLYIKKIKRQHKGLLAKEKVWFNFMYGSLYGGFKYVFFHAYFSRRPFYAIYDGASWLKERIKLEYR